MTWTVKDGSTTYPAGETKVDLDLYMSDTTGGARNGDYGSFSGSTTESFSIPTSAANATYYLGVMYFADEVAPTSAYVIEYTIKAYPSGNVAAAQTYTGTLSGVSPDNGKVYFQFAVTKSATGFAFNELASKFSLTGY